ncbi:MAG: single-stranded DNA-binding protein, partial [Terriglobia bacterium]
PWTRARVAVTTWDPETRTKSEPEWWDVVAFGDLAENMCDHLKKGNQVIAMGRCERNEYGPKMVANEVGENMRFMFKASK